MRVCVKCQDGLLVIANIFTLSGTKRIVDLFLEDMRRDVFTFKFCFIPIATDIQYTANHLNYSPAAVMNIRVFVA